MEIERTTLLRASPGACCLRNRQPPNFKIHLFSIANGDENLFNSIRTTLNTNDPIRNSLLYVEAVSVRTGCAALRTRNVGHAWRTGRRTKYHRMENDLL